MQNELKIQCPAKINLTLEVLNRRSDGFHNINSVMQTIDLFDYLTIKVTDNPVFSIVLSGTSEQIPYDERNLVHKAIVVFAEEFAKQGALETQEAQNAQEILETPSAGGFPYKISVFIEKNIPISAGLAGGSTDAAGVLFGLNKIFNTPFEGIQLHKLCAKLGSDLNFCLEGGRRLATGRGEILKKLPFEGFKVSLIKPEDLGISAKEAYTKFAQRGGRNFLNNLEGAIIDDYEVLQKIKQDYPKSVMSGSGSTYFLIDGDFALSDGFWVENGLNAIDYGVKLV